MRTLPDVGFDTDHLVTFEVDPTLAGYPPEKDANVETRILQVMAALPGVHAVAATTDPELKDDSAGNNITIPGYVPKEGENMNVEHARISAGYFSAMQMPLVTGREFTDQDRDGTEHVAVVNQSLARRFFGDVDHALGRNFGNGGGNVKTDLRIVGVVKDARHAGVRQDIVPTVFTPYLQELQFIARHTGGMGFYVRTWQDPPSAEQAIRQTVLGINSQLVLDGLRTMREQVDGNLVAERVISLLASAFGILAVVMAAVGLYGVLAYSTAQRTREIGVRMALGAQRRHILWLILKEGAKFSLGGIGLGLAGAFVVTRWLASELYGVGPADVLTYAGVALVMTLVTMLACYIPARRAMSVDPLVALRFE